MGNGKKHNTNNTSIKLIKKWVQPINKATFFNLERWEQALKETSEPQFWWNWPESPMCLSTIIGETYAFCLMPQQDKQLKHIAIMPMEKRKSFLISVNQSIHGDLAVKESIRKQAGATLVQGTTIPKSDAGQPPIPCGL